MTSLFGLGQTIESLSKKERNKIKHYPGGTNFEFGGEKKIRSIEKLEIPCNIAGKKTTFLVDVTDSDIPLLLSKPDMQHLGFRLNMGNDTLEVDRRVIELDTTSSGHYYLPVNNCEIEVHNVHLAIEEKSFGQKKKIIHKLHRQFAHPSAKNLKALMKNADAFDSDCEEIINSISEKCEVCKHFKRAPCRPVVCLPLTTKFCMFATDNKIQPSCCNGFETVSPWNLVLTFYRFVHKIQFSKSYKEEIT